MSYTNRLVQAKSHHFHRLYEEYVRAQHRLKNFCEEVVEVHVNVKINGAESLTRNQTPKRTSAVFFHQQFSFFIRLI